MDSYFNLLSTSNFKFCYFINIKCSECFARWLVCNRWCCIYGACRIDLYCAVYSMRRIYGTVYGVHHIYGHHSLWWWWRWSRPQLRPAANSLQWRSVHARQAPPMEDSHRATECGGGDGGVSLRRSEFGHVFHPTRGRRGWQMLGGGMQISPHRPLTSDRPVRPRGPSLIPRWGTLNSGARL